MYTRVTASADATLYERDTNPDRLAQNTGVDEILELSQEKHTDAYYNAFRNRVLVKFNNIPTYQGSGEYWLKLYETNEASEIPASFTVEVARATTDWTMGLGTWADTPINTDGVSWKYTKGYDTGTEWATSLGGGDYATVNSASFEYTVNTKDLEVNVTDIVSDWSASGESNYGFLIKRSNIAEQVSGSSILSYYSTETNTIYQPRLEYRYDDSSFVTGSLTAVDMTKEVLVYPYSIRANYNKNSIIKIKTVGREMYPVKTYTTESVSTLTTQYLPSSSYYSIIDTHTDEAIIPFDDDYTKLSCDSTSNYFMLSMSNFEANRYYKIAYKINDVDNGTQQYFDGNFIFEVIN